MEHIICIERKRAHWEGDDGANARNEDGRRGVRVAPRPLLRVRVLSYSNAARGSALIVVGLSTFSHFSALVLLWYLLLRSSSRKAQRTLRLTCSPEGGELGWARGGGGE